ncbi:hypothetical protein ABGT15_09175 [Flavobacterium enshiense]|uniref:hypothetical protein n=1 Tax=Flavobacterium enshiense TaxID=1341165 RepID=UPI00345D26B1
MIVTDLHYEYIETNLAFYGITDEAFREDLMDHICTHLEKSNSSDFETAYQEAINNLGGYAALQLIQRDKNEKALIHSFIRRKRNTHLCCAINAVVLLIGFVFFIYKWPLSGVLILIGFSQLILITIPMIIYEHYKLKTRKILLLNK